MKSWKIVLLIIAMIFCFTGGYIGSFVYHNRPHWAKQFGWHPNWGLYVPCKQKCLCWKYPFSEERIIGGYFVSPIENLNPRYKKYYEMDGYFFESNPSKPPIPLTDFEDVVGIKSNFLDTLLQSPKEKK